MNERNNIGHYFIQSLILKFTLCFSLQCTGGYSILFNLHNNLSQIWDILNLPMKNQYSVRLTCSNCNIIQWMNLNLEYKLSYNSFIHSALVFVCLSPRCIRSLSAVEILMHHYISTHRKLSINISWMNE